MVCSVTVSGDAAATAGHIRDAALLFRLGFVANVAFLVPEVILTS